MIINGQHKEAERIRGEYLEIGLDVLHYADGLGRFFLVEAEGSEQLGHSVEDGLLHYLAHEEEEGGICDAVLL